VAALTFVNEQIASEEDSKSPRYRRRSSGTPPIEFPGSSVQLYHLFFRAARNIWRAPEYSLARTGILLAVGLLFGSAYFDTQPTDQATLQGILGCLFATISFIGVICFSLVVPLWFKDRVVFYREQMSSVYQPWPLFNSVALVELPYLALVSALFSLPLYLMIGLDSDPAKVMFFWGAYFVFITMMVFFGQTLAILLPDQKTAILIGTVCVSFWNLFSGFLLPYPLIPDFLQWLYWLSPVHYLIEALISNQYHCAGKPACPLENVTTSAEIDCCPSLYALVEGQNVSMTVSNYVEDILGYKYENMWSNIGMLLGLVLIFRALSYYGIAYVRHITR
jgi:ABC-type multidrug transport system permease subunit